MRESDAIRLRHVLDAAREAVAFAAGHSRQDLDGDRMLSLSLVRLLEVMGEAAKGVSDDLRNASPNIPWRQMAGMRDRLIHAYFDVNLDAVWRTVTDDLPPLIDQLESMGVQGGE